MSQLVRSPGVYFESEIDKSSDKEIHSVRIIPSRGAWLEFEIDKRDQVGVRIDRKRKQSVTVFLKALGLTSEEIAKHFAGFDSVLETLEKDTIVTKEEALKDIYRKLRPGEQVAAEAARLLLDNFFFNEKALRPRPRGSLQAQPQARNRPRPRRVGTDLGRHRSDHPLPARSPRGTRHS